jgi:hypothetical protein
MHHYFSLSGVSEFIGIVCALSAAPHQTGEICFGEILSVSYLEASFDWKCLFYYSMMNVIRLVPVKGF